jgi:hypothetical protein
MGTSWSKMISVQAVLATIPADPQQYLHEQSSPFTLDNPVYQK